MNNNDKLSKEHEKIISPTRQIIDKFKHNKLAMVGLIFFIFLIVVIVGAKLYIHFTNYDLANVDISQKYMKPSMKHLFGTDAQGRDLFIRVLAGGWISIQVGLLSTFLSVKCFIRKNIPINTQIIIIMTIIVFLLPRFI
jgi:peptide/nickel transport system permease protein